MNSLENDFKNALGWYRVSTKSMCEVRIENKELELLNFNPCGSSTFRDKNSKIYVIRTCEIDSMKPCKDPKSENESRLKQPKYKRGFKFPIANISPINVPNNHIMLYIPLCITLYECEIDSIHIGYTENSYIVKILNSGCDIGKCEMKEKIIDKIVNDIRS